MKQVVDILLPGADDTIEVEVDYLHHDAYLGGARDGGEPEHFEILSADHDGKPMELTDPVYWAIMEAMV